MSLSLRFHPKSDILSVWPPWTNKSSGGPSCFSSSVYWAPNLLRSQTMILLSWAEDASKFDCIWLNLTLLTSLVWLFSENNFVLTFLISQTATVVSADPVHTKYWSNGEQSTDMISWTWPSIEIVGCEGSLISQILIFLSSPTDKNTCSSKLFQATSSTTDEWASK